MPKIQIPIQRATLEFAIIVLGILAAFAVENWRDTRAAAVLEAQYVDRLQLDVALDIERLNLTLDLAEQKNVALREIRTWNAGVDSSERLVENLRRAIYLGWSLPNLNTATIEDLKSTGRLGLVEDADLRRAVLDYYRNLNNVRNRLERRMTPFPTYVYSIMDPELLSEDDDRYAAALKMCEEMCKITFDAAETGEFQRLATAEANYGRMIVELLPAFREQARELQSRLLVAVDAR